MRTKKVINSCFDFYCPEHISIFNSRLFTSAWPIIVNVVNKRNFVFISTFLLHVFNNI